MSGEFPFVAKLVSPAKCNEKPWDLWVSEIGHASPRRDDDGAAAFAAPAAAGKQPRAPKPAPRYRRAGLHRLRRDSMSLHGLFPQMDNLNAAVCHMCGVVVKCSAAYRHLLESHSGSEPILPPPPPAPTVKLKSTHSRSRYKPERKVELPPPPPPVDILPVPMEASPLYTPTAPLSRLVLPQPDLQYLEEPGTSAVTGEVQVRVETGELPVVSIQDTEELPLGENITDDIVDIMNSEGIQSADDITNTADWKNIIRDIGKMQDLNFPSSVDGVQPQDLFPPVDAALGAFGVTDAELAGLQFAPPLAPAAEPGAPPKPAAGKAARAKPKTKFNLREYDPNKHCGVATAENPKPCTRSLTCKAHALSLRRAVDGRAKPFDTLLAEHRAARDAPAAARDRAVDDIYHSLVSLEDAPALPAAALAALLSPPRPPPSPPRVVTTPAAPATPVASTGPARDDPPPALVAADVCWYAASPRPLALCTFNAAHAGGAVTLGKRFATVRSNIKSSLSRSQCKTGATNNFYYNQNVSLTKTVHMNASKTNKPEVRKLIVTCSAGGAKVQQTLSDLFGGELRAVNGHAGPAAPLGLAGHAPLGPHAPLAGKARPPGKGKRPALDLAFGLDPLLDEKC